MITYVTPITDSVSANRGRGITKVSRNIRTKLCSMTVLIAFAVVMLAVSITPAMAATPITNCTELQDIRNDLNGDYYLANDIDCSGFDYDSDGKGFMPIGNLSSNFTGTFDGKSYKITNLVINRSSMDYVGLFGYAGSESEITNVGLEDVDVNGSSYVGGLVGNNSGTITNCYSTGSVSGSSYVGGLVGDNSGTITNCYSTGSVSGSSYVGGLVGYTDGTITNCYSTGSVSGTSVFGGLVGYNFGTITYSYWDKETSLQPSSTFGTGKTTAEMKQQATFEGWDFTNIWAIEEDVTYPYLQWQDAAAEPLKITSFAPSSPINDMVNTWNTFNVTVNQEVNVSWYLNNSPLFTNMSVTEANYTLHAEFVGENNISAVAKNTNGTDMQTWVWNVTADTTPPTLTISSPREGQIYNTSTVSLNVTADETIDTWLYNINGTTNITFTSNTTLSSLPDRNYNVTVFANDSAGNIGSAIVNFTIDTTPPSVPTIDVPANGETLTTATTWVNGTISADSANVTVYVNGSITNDSVAVFGTTYNISNVPLGADGSYEINVSAKDAFGNVNTTNATVTVTVAGIVDNTAPTITIDLPQEGYNYTTSTVALNVSADESIDTWQYSINGTTNVTFTSNTTLSSLPDGDHNVTVFANDSAGNIGSAIVNFTIDTTPPSVPTIDVPANGETLTTATTWVNGTISADSANVTVYVNGSITNDSVAVFGTTYNISNVPLGADGSYEINVSAMDAAGNVNTTNATVTVTVDTTPPDVPTITVPADSSTLTTAMTWVNGTISSDTANVTVYVNGSIKNNSVAVSSTTYNISNVPLGVDGDHEINVSVKDAVGNVNTTNASVTVNVDTTAPIISIVTPTASSNVSKKGGQQMYVNFTYVEANPKNYTVLIRNATAIINSATDTTTSSPVNVSFTMNATAAEGRYNVTVTMWDNASHTNTTIEVNAVIIDSTPPTAPTNLIHTDDAPGDYDNDNSTDISWSESTDVSTVIYRIYRDGVLNDSTESTTYTFTNETEGSHEYNVSAIDSAGNINTTNESVTVIVDYTDPVIHNVSLSDNTTSYGQQIVVSVNVTDKITNITSVTAGSTILTHQSGMLWNGTITGGYGTNTVTVTAYDNASNTATNSNLSYTGPAAPKDSRGGGGGGVGGSDEPENVEESAILRIYLASGSSSTYNFNNVVTSVEVTPVRTYGLVAAKIEVLFDQPGSITTDPPAGIIHKYVNVFFGTSGWSKDKFSSSVINFQVPASWFEENNIDPATVTLYRYHDGEWQSLTTTMKGQAGGNYQYSSPTPGFSTFMILGQVEESSSGEPAATTDSGTVADPTPAPEATSTKGTPGFGILVGIMGILIAVHSGRK